MSGVIIYFLLFSFPCSTSCVRNSCAGSITAAALEHDTSRGGHFELPLLDSVIEVENFSVAANDSLVLHRVSTNRRVTLVAILVVATLLLVGVTIMVCSSKIGWWHVACESLMEPSMRIDRLPTEHGDLNPGTYWDTSSFDELDEREAETRSDSIANLVSQISGEFELLSQNVPGDEATPEIAVSHSSTVLSERPSYVAIVPSTEVDERDDAGMTVTRRALALESWFGAKLTWWESKAAFWARARPDGSVALLDVKKVQVCVSELEMGPTSSQAWTERDNASKDWNSIKVTSAKTGMALVLNFKNNLRAHSWASALTEVLRFVKDEEIRKLVAQAKARGDQASTSFTDMVLSAERDESMGNSFGDSFGDSYDDVPTRP